MQGCVTQGTASAQAEFNALNTCLGNAVSGSCASACANIQSNACQQCMATACMTEINGCN